MRAIVKGAAWVAGLLALSGVASAQPVRIVSGSKAMPVNPDRILFEQDGSFVLKTAEAVRDDFDDLYVVNTNNWFTLPESMSDYGQVLGFEAGKFAVMRLREDKVEALSHLLHHSGMACGVLVKLSGLPIEQKRLATPTPVLPVATRDARVVAAVALISADNIRATIDELSAIQTRHHSSPTGAAVADMLKQKYDALKGSRTDVTAAVYSHGSATRQPSLVVRIEGTTRPTEVIILGSHLDSIAFLGGRSPGADDNASGTATNLEIFRVLMESGVRPERSIEIHAYAAEEIGLIGSDDMATDYKSAGVNVVAMMQFDMTLWKAAGAVDKIWFVTNNTDAGFNDLLASLTDTYVGMAWGKGVLTGGSSDHASWYRKGYPTAFPFENPQSYNRSIHTANDTTAVANAFSQAAGFAKLGAAYAMHFGGVN